MKRIFPIDMRIYNEDKILLAIEDFSDTCNIQFLSSKDVEIEADPEDIESIFSEFMNYVISL